MVVFICLLVIVDGMQMFCMWDLQTLDSSKMYSGIHVKAELRNNYHTHNENNTVLNLLCETNEIMFTNAT